MTEAIRVRVRYDQPNEKGKTRRERNEDFGEQHSPPLDVPECGHHIWRWYWEISDGQTRRVRDGYCERIDWVSWASWRAETGHIVRPSERAILRAMDRAYCAEMNQELTDFRAREADAQARNAPKPGQYRKGR